MFICMCVPSLYDVQYMGAYVYFLTFHEIHKQNFVMLHIERVCFKVWRMQ